ncbi:hypothetical protein [Roseimaritima ulvae]|uniref:Uncharacterized protein n=1 Tax=Roseimaritima ulvae TaxID=980254 RepID=A0A5B9QNY0_9BACT|nr:hypothetical protein [Roseimaritima ulvae]QEG40807.1 hypothetical protein UC8_28250 [Roseimaritima ulvae]
MLFVQRLRHEARVDSRDERCGSHRSAKISLAAMCLCICFAHGHAVHAETAAQMPAEHRRLFEQYCYECHDAAT